MVLKGLVGPGLDGVHWLSTVLCALRLWRRSLFHYIDRLRNVHLENLGPNLHRRYPFHAMYT